MKSGRKLTIASSEANPPKLKPRSPAALSSPVSAEQRADKAVAARHPAAPRQRQHAIMPVRDGLARPRQRRIEPRDFRAARSGCPTMSPTSRIWCLTSSRVRGTANSARCSPFAFNNSRVERLSNSAGDDDVGLEHQHVFRPARQHRIAACIVAAQDCQRVARKPARAQGSVRDRPASAAIDRCRHSSTRCAADWRPTRRCPATPAPSIATRNATPAVASDIRPRHDHGLALDIPRDRR